MKDIKKLVAQMTLEEKASLCSGEDFWHLKDIERLGIPSVMVTDGPHGLRKQLGESDHIGLNESVPATCFPTASALAATWNRELVHEVGEALGEECRTEKVAVILGPGANIKRSPLCGRNFEYFSEDPYLTSEMAKNHINGVQSQGIGTSLKHFVANNQETRRMTIDTFVDERALREIYLAGFEGAVKEAQPWTVMCAYNKVNDTFCFENKYLMTNILKEEWGHEGLVVTDWGAMDDRAHGLLAGVELSMPGAPNGNDARVVAAVQAGELDEAILDQAVERLLALIFKSEETLSKDYTYDQDAHHALARRVAGEGVVLLKNDGVILPIQKNTNIALIGQFAKTPRYQGAGSSLINPTRLDNLYDEMAATVGKANLTYADGYTLKGDVVDESLLEEAVATAKAADIAIVCVGLTDMYEVEGLDRTHMKMPPGHEALVQRIAEVHDNVVVVLSNGSPIEMPWVDDVSAIVEGYLGGQAGAGAVADILSGKVNPSGKLAETFPLKLEDNPSYEYFPSGPINVEYRESIYVGYRYYDTVKQDVLFPFGHGLSYTTFEYSDIQLSENKISDTDSVTITFKVKNTGTVAGKEITQLYVHDIESSAFRPEKELKGFAKVSLQPKEEITISIELGQRAFAYYNTTLKNWHVESGDFAILVGASAKDIRLNTSLSVQSAKEAPAVEQGKFATYYNFPKGSAVSQQDFEELLGRAVPENKEPKKGDFSINTSISDMGDSFIGRMLAKNVNDQIAKMNEGQEGTASAFLMEAIGREMPLRSMFSMGDGQLTRGMVEGLVMMVNGKFFKGLGTLIKAARNK